MRRLTSSANSIPNFRKKVRREEAARPEQDTCRGRRDEQYRPYYKKQGGKQQSTSQSHQETKSGRLSCHNTRSKDPPPQQQRQEIGRKSTSGRSKSLEILVGDVDNRAH
ncbi:hypothetical protein TNCV_2174731 [Trichonephila clavipes]|nr:hypothetical protein TNCV_2174731 [Trichonephila clavipes]